MTDDINRDEFPEVVLVFNGSLGMSPGKMAGQAFQGAARWQHSIRNSYPDESLSWHCEGTRTITKIAKTSAMFDRICAEVPGFIMVDEGHTEVEPGSATVFVSRPFLHKDRPAVLDNKKVRLL